MRAKSNHLHPQVVGFDEAQKGYSFPYIRTDGKRSDNKIDVSLTFSK